MKYPKGIDGKLDRVFSQLVRERSDWTCERCGAEFPERKGSGLHASHFWGRSRRSTRWYGWNVFAHCCGCHRYLSRHPVEFNAWVQEQMHDDRFNDLTLRANSVHKYTKSDKEEMLVHLKAQLDYIRRRRAEKGETGYIDFVDWD
jgi:hypothetical protein